MPTNQRDGKRPVEQMVVRVPNSLREQVREIAKGEQRTLSAEVRWLMERRVEEKEAA